MKKLLSLALLGSLTALLLYACGGGNDGTPTPTMAVASNTTLPANPTSTAAVTAIPFSFAAVPSFGTTSTTTVTFTNTATTPAFSIATATGTATGTTQFGSCIFAVAAVTGTVGSMRVGDTITVNPCNLNVNTTGAVANGVATSRSVALLLGAASSAGATVTLAVNPGGQLTLNGTAVGSVTLVPISG